MTLDEKKKLKEWADYVADIANATPVEVNLSEAEKARKKEYLESHPLEWIKYFFPNYAKYDFAPFQEKAIRRILNNPEWFEVLSWSRELAKSTIVMFCVMYLTLTGRKKNVILASATQTSAEKLLRPYKGNFEANGRIKAFYGEQQNLGQWTESEFVTKGGAAFYAIGAGNAPRGSRNEAIRPDVLLVDDFDTDEDCRNPATIDKKWKWWEKALYPTRSVSEPTTIIFCGNIIAKDTCVGRAGQKADHWDVINLVDKQGNSTWPQKNTPEHIARIRSSISSAAFQGEYMNNPVTEGKVFQNVTMGKVPPLKKFKFVLAYGDPSYSNSRNKATSFKALALLGMCRNTLYVIKCFCARETNANYIEWFYLLKEFVGSQTTVYFYQENNTLQDPFFEQVFKPLIREANERKHSNLYIIGDGRDKIDKATRIEANLEPLDRNGRLVFNEDERDNPHMQEMCDQFRMFELSLPYPADGPDCVEGGYNMILRKMKELDPGVTIAYKDFQDNNKYRL
jgi:hypothetical protein